jgi:hypothetical protein
MPQFVFTSPRIWLSYRVGRLFGAGLTKVAREARFLTDRTKTASALERSAWLYRCMISFAMVGAEFLIARLFFASRLDHVLSLPLSVGVLLVLPRPHVRWPLLTARAFVLVTLLAVLERVHVWSLKSYSETVRSWDSVYSLGSLVLMFGLWIWVLFALRPRATTAAAVAGDQQGGASRRENDRTLVQHPSGKDARRRWGSARGSGDSCDLAKPPHQTT